MADETNLKEVKKLEEQLGGSNRMLNYKEGIHRDEEMPVEHEGDLLSLMEVTGDLATSLAGNGASDANGEKYQRTIIDGPETFGREHFRILIDSGCTHNFLDENVAHMMGCELTGPKILLRVNLANGEAMNCRQECNGFTWQMQGVSFTADFMTLDLQQSGTEMILGVQWLSTLGDILWNFHTLRMEFWKDGKKVVLEGIKGNPILPNMQPSVPTLLLSSTEPISVDCLAATGEEAGLILIDSFGSDPFTMCTINGYQATVAKRWELGSPTRKAGLVPEDTEVSIVKDAVEERVLSSSSAGIHLPSQHP